MNAFGANAIRAVRMAGAICVFLGCAPAKAPDALIGTWYSEDQRYEGRTLEIDREWVRFMQGASELSAVQIRAVAQEGSGAGPIHFELAGVDRENEEITLSVEMELRPTEMLRLETQPLPWRRLPGGPGAKTRVVPWGGEPREQGRRGPT